MCSLINKQLLLTAYAYLFIMEQQKGQQGSEAVEFGKSGGFLGKVKSLLKRNTNKIGPQPVGETPILNQNVQASTLVNVENTLEQKLVDDFLTKIKGLFKKTSEKGHEQELVAGDVMILQEGEKFPGGFVTVTETAGKYKVTNAPIALGGGFVPVKHGDLVHVDRVVQTALYNLNRPVIFAALSTFQETKLPKKADGEGFSEWYGGQTPSGKEKIDEFIIMLRLLDFMTTSGKVWPKFTDAQQNERTLKEFEETCCSDPQDWVKLFQEFELEELMAKCEYFKNQQEGARKHLGACTHEERRNFLGALKAFASDTMFQACMEKMHGWMKDDRQRHESMLPVNLVKYWLRYLEERPTLLKQKMETYDNVEGIARRIFKG